MLQKLQKRIEELHMITEKDLVLVGVSGGADSVCLLLILLELQKKMGFSMEAVHVEHGIRGEESRQDADFVEDLCRMHRMKCHRVSVNVPEYCKKTGLGTEEAARILRYQVFSELAREKCAKIALAHHQEDNAETILFQMIRGSSLTGMCGMQPIRTDENGVCYIRPLLSFHRSDMEAFLRERKIQWREDSTNSELDYSRNFLRAKVVPQLEQINAQAVSHINQTADHLAEIKDYLDLETERLWQEVASVEEDIILHVDAIIKLHPVMQRQIAYKAIVQMAGRKKDITSLHVEDFLNLCKGQSGKKLSLPYGIVAWKEFHQVHVAFAEKTDKITEHFDVICEISEALLAETYHACVEGGQKVLSWELPDGVLHGRVFEKKKDCVEIPRKAYTKWFDYDKIKKGFCIRTRRSGDYFIGDVYGHRKKLKTYFIDEKIPMAERERCLLLARERQVLWLIGGRISEDIKVSHQTKYILEITYDGGNGYE